MRQYIYYLVIGVLFSSCMGTRYLEANERLIVRKAKVQGVKGSLKEEVESLIIQQPNKKFLGFLPIVYLAHAYQMGLKKFSPDKCQVRIDSVNSKFDKKISSVKSTKRRNRLIAKQRQKTDKLELKKTEGNWLMRNGEVLAIYNEPIQDQTVNQIETYLNTRGFLQGKARFNTNFIGQRKLSLNYVVKTGPRYTIDSICYQVNDPLISELLETNRNFAEIRTTLSYDQPSMERERERIYQLLTDNGYYTFSKQYVSFQVDTASLGDHKAILNVLVRDPQIGKHKQYQVDSIIFSTVSGGPAQYQANDYQGITYSFGESRYSPKVLTSRIFIARDSLFSRSQTLETQRQLSYLDAFRFVNINYDSAGTEGLVANIFTKPMNKYQTTNEIGFISASQQQPGPFINLGLKIRNVFGGLDIFQLNGNFSLLGLPSVDSASTSSDYSLRQFEGQGTLTFPQFLFPASDSFKKRIGAFNPQTQISVGYIYEDRLGDYERSKIETSLAYIWRVKNSIRYSFKPFTGSYIDVTRIDSDFQDFLDDQTELGNGALQAAFNSSWISSTSFEVAYNVNEYGSYQKNSSFFRVLTESGGTFLNLLGEDVFGTDTTFSVFKWWKLHLDYRNLKIIDSKSSLAFRFNFGVASPYGDRQSLTLPYNKRFYVGGSNSLRAWPVRRLGPGAYGDIKTTIADKHGLSEISYQLEQGGDMVIETSLEYRKNLIGFVDYALFLDAGNIWIINSDQKILDQQGDDGIFQFENFLSEFAVGAGLGLRLDFSFLIFRLDWAAQVVDPAQAPGERFVLDNINFLSRFGNNESDKSFLSNKTNLNLGIGFPF